MLDAAREFIGAVVTNWWAAACFVSAVLWAISQASGKAEHANIPRRLLPALVLLFLFLGAFQAFYSKREEAIGMGNDKTAALAERDEARRQRDQAIATAGRLRSAGPASDRRRIEGLQHTVDAQANEITALHEQTTHAEALREEQTRDVDALRQRLNQRTIPEDKMVVLVEGLKKLGRASAIVRMNTGTEPQFYAGYFFKAFFQAKWRTALERAEANPFGAGAWLFIGRRYKKGDEVRALLEGAGITPTVVFVKDHPPDGKYLAGGYDIAIGIGERP